MGSLKGDLKPEPPGTQARRSPSPRAPSPRAPEINDDASAAGRLSPAIAYRIKTPGQALHEAVTRKDLDGVTRILRASPDIVDEKNERGRTPLHIAAQWGLNEIVKLLISKGAEIGAKSRWKYTPLHFAVESHRHDVVVTLLDSGADLESGTRDGKTPLHLAVLKEIKNKQELLAILLIRGASCNALNNEGSTPLQYAVKNGNLSNARALCAFGADPYFKDKHGENAFDYAKKLENDLGGEMAEVLAKWEKCGRQARKVMRAPQLSKCITKEGRVDVSEMLSWVSGVGQELLVEFILEYMAKDTPKIVDSEGLIKGWRPIHHAAWAGQSHVVEVLLAHGCAVDATTSRHKWTPLHLAASKGRQRTLTVLLDNGADILAKAQLDPPWRVGADSGAQQAVLLTKATAFWLAAGERHTKSLDVLLQFALRMKDDNRHITAMDDYTKARQHFASLSGQNDDDKSGNDDSSSMGPDHNVQPVNSTPFLLPEIDLPGTNGSFDGGRFFSVEATSVQLSHSNTYQLLLSVWDKFDFKKGRDRPIRVAILDTGLDVANQNFRNPRLSHFADGKPVWSSKGEPSQYERIVACEDFTGDGPIMRKDEMKDLDGHGTQVAELILRIAPRSELYIARICEGEINRGTSARAAPTNNPVKQPQPNIVAKAIDWAREQKVDIINMSFGFQDSYMNVRAALKAVRDAKILVFAATFNDGRNRESAAWPASDPHLTIGVHSCNEHGTKSDFSSGRMSSSNFMFVGEKVITQWPEAKGGGFREDDGTSFSTPAVAAMAALILGFAWQHICKKQREEAERLIDLEELRELGGMERVLRRISVKDDFQWYSYIHPLLLWKDFEPNPTDDDRTHKDKVKQHAWDVIVKSLRL